MAKRDSNFNPTGTSRGIRRNTGCSADWAKANALTLQRAITCASIVGGALRFGYSRDGGAYAIGIYGDGETYTEFVPCHDDIDITLELIAELFESLKDDRGIAQNGA